MFRKHVEAFNSLFAIGNLIIISRHLQDITVKTNDCS